MFFIPHQDLDKAGLLCSLCKSYHKIHKIDEHIRTTKHIEKAKVINILIEKIGEILYKPDDPPVENIEEKRVEETKN